MYPKFVILVSDVYSEDDEGRKQLHKLAAINRPLEISFKEMVQLMGQCQFLDSQQRTADTSADGTERDEAKGKGSEPSTVANTLPLLRGIIPGWSSGECLLFGAL